MFVIFTLVAQSHSFMTHFLFASSAKTFATLVREFLFARNINGLTVIGCFHCCQTFHKIIINMLFISHHIVINLGSIVSSIYHERFVIDFTRVLHGRHAIIGRFSATVPTR